MNIDEFERLAGKIEGDGNSTTNAATIVALVDTFLSLPCTPKEMDSAARMRVKWAQMMTGRSGRRATSSGFSR
jgi:hypothetical protein